jgi:hypothetical protein
VVDPRSTGSDVDDEQPVEVRTVRQGAQLHGEALAGLVRDVELAGERAAGLQSGRAHERAGP